MQELLNGPHTRVRVDMAIAPVQGLGFGIVSPKGKGRGGAGRQTGMMQFFKGAHRRRREWTCDVQGMSGRAGLASRAQGETAESPVAVARVDMQGLGFSRRVRLRRACSCVIVVRSKRMWR